MLQLADNDDSAPLVTIWLAVGDASVRNPSSPFHAGDPSPPLCTDDGNGDLVDLDEALILKDEVILRDIEDCCIVACRLAKWTRPPLFDAYISQSCSVGKSISTCLWGFTFFTLLGFL